MKNSNRKTKALYITVEEFMRNAKPCSLFKDVQEKILQESQKRLIDPYWLRVNQDWSELGHQVMGAEVDKKK